MLTKLYCKKQKFKFQKGVVIDYKAGRVNQVGQAGACPIILDPYIIASK